MATLTKRVKAIREKVEGGKTHSIEDALSLLKEVSSVKFVESVEAAVVLGVDPRKSDQVVRGATLLPKGSGKEVTVAVMAQGPNAQAATDAGADIVGFEDLAERIKTDFVKGTLKFDVLIATPDAMRLIGQLGRVLGPKGLMPNPKVGTVTTDVGKAVQNAKAGQVSYRTDKAGIIHCPIGKVNFEVGDLSENLSALVRDLKKAKPSNAKGVYLKKIVLSTTMGPGIIVDHSVLT